MEQEFVDRVRQLVSRTGGQSALARKTDMSLGAIQRYLKGGEPTRTALIRLAEAGGVSLNWLVYGCDPVGQGSFNNSTYVLYGLEQLAGQENWYTPIKYPIDASLEWPDPECFAVVISDHSQVPEGIFPGHVLIVSPHTSPVQGDVVYLQRMDGKTTLMRMLSRDSECLYAESWTRGGQELPQEKLHAQIKLADLKTIAPVLFIKRRS